MARILISASRSSISLTIWSMKRSALKSSTASGSKLLLRQLNLTIKSTTTFKDTRRWFLFFYSILGLIILFQKTLQKLVTLSLFSRQYSPNKRSPLALSYFVNSSFMMDIKTSRSQLYLSRLIHINTLRVFSCYWLILSLMFSSFPTILVISLLSPLASSCFIFFYSNSFSLCRVFSSGLCH